MKNKTLPKGILDKTYHWDRKTKLAPKYRLQRRTYEVIKAIKNYCPNAESILDIGTADGLMLRQIKKEFPRTECIGLEYSKELIAFNKDKNIKIIQGDAHHLPFENNCFNVAIATAVIEHLTDPPQALAEAHRVLINGGIFIITTPHPFFDKVAQVFGHLDKENHQENFTLKKLEQYLKRSGFQILYSKKFMLSPIGFPGELKIERVLRCLKLDFVLSNQLMVGKK